MTFWTDSKEATMAKSSKDATKKPPRGKKTPEPKITKTGETPDDSLSEEDLKKVSGGPIYMHGTGGGAG